MSGARKPPSTAPAKSQHPRVDQDVKSTQTLMVAVRVRPLLNFECAKGQRKDILRVMDRKVVVVLDPDENKDVLDIMQNRTKEKRYKVRGRCTVDA